MHRAPRPVDKQNRASQGGSTYKQLQLLFVTRYQRNRGRADVLGDRICTALIPSEPFFVPKEHSRSNAQWSPSDVAGAALTLDLKRTNEFG